MKKNKILRELPAEWEARRRNAKMNLSIDEERQLIAEFRLSGNGDALCDECMYFVLTIVRRYYVPGKDDLDLLLSAANDGLIHAAKTYDEIKGFRFLSYAIGLIADGVKIQAYGNN